MNRKIVNPSDQTQAFLPLFVGENYQTFVNFMAKAAESEERQGFGQDLLQNLQRYRDFDTFAKGIVEGNNLASGLSKDEEDELELVDALGFPLNNGVILIGDEVILYRTRTGNTLQTLQRAAGATTVLPSVTSVGVYSDGPAEEYVAGTEVKNISSLFLSAMLSNIHQSYTPNIYADKVFPEVDRTILLQNIKDFYSAKGSKLSVISLFKFIYGDPDVDVWYPGDKMIRPSAASWQEFLIGTALPFPIGLLGETGTAFNNQEVLGAQLKFKTYGSDRVNGTAIVEFATQSILPTGIGYTLYLDGDSFAGNVDLNNAETPSTILKRNALYYNEVGTVAADVTTITVDSTNDFPESGVIFIGAEAIRYTSKSQNQFFGCQRAIDGHGGPHSIGTVVYGAEYAELTLANGKYTNIWLGALYRGVEVTNGGILSNVNDTVAVGAPGDTDYRDQVLTTVQENTNDTLVSMTTTSNVTDVTDVSVGVSAVYYDKDNVFVESSGLPDYDIGPFSTDGSVGPDLKDDASSTHVIPRVSELDRYLSRDTYSWATSQTGTGRIGMYVDGTPIVSMRSGDKLYSGGLTGVEVTKGGSEYGDRVAVVFEPDNGAVGEAVVEDGVITRVDVTTNANFTEIPVARISEGEGAVFDLTFDQWGRITNVTIVSGGQYYFDTPRVELFDSSGVGIGAVLACTVNAFGRIDTVTIINSGLDYRPSTTELITITKGNGAVLTASVETYNFNRVSQINNSATELKDSGNGILVNMTDPEGPKDTFAMAERPIKLLEELDTNEAAHSPLIGWAYDGNPIYGPRGFLNGKNANDGVGAVAAGYALQENRTTVFPEGIDRPGSLPPDQAEYPMGTFIEDYIFDPENAGIVGYVTTELDQYILDDQEDRRLRYQFEFGDSILDEYNGRLCNTPEFPEDKYPGGVYCYFTTVFGGQGTFPYVIGPKFRNVPSTQNVIVYNKDAEIIRSSTGAATYTDSILTLEQGNLKRLRSASIPDAPIDPTFDIVQVEPGVVDSVVCIDGSPDNATIKDTFYFDNTGTQGSGAAAIVDEIKGKNVIEAGLVNIETRLISHAQRVNLEDDADADDYVFVLGSTIRTPTGTEGYVLNWSYETKYLDVYITTERLLRFGDTFADNKGTNITIADSKFPNNTLFTSETVGTRSTYAGWEEPDRSSATPGDLWWSSRTGRLYIYFENVPAEGETAVGNWVTTQPSGSRSFYADIEDTDALITTPTTQTFASPQEDTAVTISTMAPSARADGTPNASGDLWWSTHTGMLYMWIVETSTNDDDGTLKNNPQWVATDPTAALANNGDQRTETSILNTTPADVISYTQSTNVLISEGAPTFMNDGVTPPLPGTLWWSPASGKMYIYYSDADSSQWVITNPTTTPTGPNALDVLVTDDGSGLDTLTFLPVPDYMQDLWFEPNLHADDFKVGNYVDIRYGVPGNEDLFERVQITKILPQKGRYLVDRAPEPYNNIELLHGAQVNNISRYLYQVTCDEPHNLKVKDPIKLLDSGWVGLTGPQTVYRVGKTVEASFTAVVVSGSVTEVLIDDPGSGYDERFYLTFAGGDGLGAQAVAFIDEETGSVTSTFVLAGGSGYTSAPTITHQPRLTTKEFMILVGRAYGDGGPKFRYTTTARQIFGTPATIRMLSSGLGYYDLPEIKGLVRAEDIGAVVKPIIISGGTSIIGFDIERKGFGYKNPIAIIEDITEAGSGATATVSIDENGSVSSVNIVNGGTGYVEPVVTLVENTGEFFATTKDIGKISGFVLVEPGSVVNVDSISYPEILPPLRIVVYSYPVNFSPGEEVWQGDPEGENKLFSGTVSEYNPANHVLTLVNIDGNIDTNEVLYGESTATANVYSYDEADFRLYTSSFVKPEGRFVDGTGTPSDKDSVIQDSYYYQLFSYVISTSKQKDDFEDMVLSTTHPVGNIMFAEVRLESVAEVGVSGQVAIIG